MTAERRQKSEAGGVSLNLNTILLLIVTSLAGFWANSMRDGIKELQVSATEKNDRLIRVEEGLRSIQDYMRAKTTSEGETQRKLDLIEARMVIMERSKR